LTSKLPISQYSANNDAVTKMRLKKKAAHKLMLIVLGFLISLTSVRAQNNFAIHRW